MILLVYIAHSILYTGIGEEQIKRFTDLQQNTRGTPPTPSLPGYASDLFWGASLICEERFDL